MGDFGCNVFYGLHFSYGNAQLKLFLLWAKAVFRAKGWWLKSSCPPSKVCLPWVSKEGTWDVPCPGRLGVFKSLCPPEDRPLLSRRSVFMCLFFPEVRWPRKGDGGLLWSSKTRLIVTFAHSPENFCGIFFLSLPGNFAVKNGGDLWWTFPGLLSPTKRSTKNSSKIEEISSKISGQNSGKQFEKFEEFWFCNFSDLINPRLFWDDFQDIVWNSLCSLFLTFSLF